MTFHNQKENLSTFSFYLNIFLAFLFVGLQASECYFSLWVVKINSPFWPPVPTGFNAFGNDAGKSVNQGRFNMYSEGKYIEDFMLE